MEKLYSQMTSEEQLAWVTKLTEFTTEKLPILEKLGDAWEMQHRKDFEMGMKLLFAFSFARDYASKALHYGDYKARVGRIRLYIDRIKEEIAGDMAVKGADGRIYALVRPTVPARRRGRPTIEEAAAKAKGETIAPKDPGLEKQLKIAELAGLDVVMSQESPRELNNQELAEERAKRQEEYNRTNPSLFDEAANQAAATQPAPQQYMHLDELKWLMSKELQDRVDSVRGLRAEAAAKAEFAKGLAAQGADADTIAPYTKEAQEATEAYEDIYESVDTELATVWYRLQNDEPYRNGFVERFKGVDLQAVGKQLKPYWEKKRSPEFEITVKAIIEQESPEYVAKKAAEEELKKEAEKRISYIRRNDKSASEARVAGIQERIDWLRKNMGDEVADIYLPFLVKTKEELAAKQAEEAKAAQAAEAEGQKTAEEKPAEDQSK